MRNEVPSLRRFLRLGAEFVRLPLGGIEKQKKPSGRNSAEGQESKCSYRKDELCQ
jgi:hypothetical protein